MNAIFRVKIAINYFLDMSKKYLYSIVIQLNNVFYVNY